MSKKPSHDLQVMYMSLVGWGLQTMPEYVLAFVEMPAERQTPLKHLIGSKAGKGAMTTSA